MLHVQRMLLLFHMYFCHEIFFLVSYVLTSLLKLQLSDFQSSSWADHGMQ